MKLKFSIRSLLVLVAIVAIGTALQVRLNSVISTVEHSVEHIGSSFHQNRIEEAKTGYLPMQDPPSTYHAFEESLALNRARCTPSILDLCFFRREITYNSSVILDCLRRDVEKYKNRKLSPDEERYAGHRTKIYLETNVKFLVT
ncbi:hypothetical protein OAG71_04075, partial [bacterium]|nr:hypothetical protein [bacterium]